MCHVLGVLLQLVGFISFHRGMLSFSSKLT
jgi:hypothetical protein